MCSDVTNSYLDCLVKSCVDTQVFSFFGLNNFNLNSALQVFNVVKAAPVRLCEPVIRNAAANCHNFSTLIKVDSPAFPPIGLISLLWFTVQPAYCRGQPKLTPRRGAEARYKCGAFDWESPLPLLASVDTRC